MPTLRDRQADFFAALLESGRSAPDGIFAPGEAAAGSRFDIYRNNRMVSLVEALAALYPAVETLVGQDFFRAMAREFILASPPTSPVLIDYGGGFPAFVATFQPAKELDYLADVARVEWAWHCAYNAADADCESPGLLTDLPPDQIADLRLTFHPSVHVVASQFPAISLWNSNIANSPRAQTRINWRPETGLLYRAGTDVEVNILSPGRARFLCALVNGDTLLAAAGTAVEVEPDFDLSPAVGIILSLEIVTDYQL